MKLSGGMVIRALIEARLFGKRLLTLEADVTVLPAQSDGLLGANSLTPDGPFGVAPGESSVAADPAAGSLGRIKAAPGGTAHGERLARASRSLEQAAEELGRAREAMP
jgi:hypothetical protein